MRDLPIVIINRIMLFHAHPTDDMIRQFIIHTAWARYIHINHG